MPEKKAAKKTAKKAAKKAAKHVMEPGKDLRRSYEHLGRAQVLRGSLTGGTAEAVDALIGLAEAAIKAENNRDGAGLLRASEHLSFGALALDPAGAKLSKELKVAVQKQYEELVRRAEDHWDESDAPGLLGSIYTACWKNADKAMKQGEYRRGLEFARAAEALAHVNGPELKELSAGEERLQLKGF